MEKRKVVETLFDQKIIRVLRLFINNPTQKYYLREVAKVAKVPAATTYRIIKTMKELELIDEEKIKHLKLYTLNEKNAAPFFELLEDKRSALQEFSDFISGVEGVQLVVLHGKEEKDKASVLIVGINIGNEVIREKVVELRQKYNFNLIYLVLDPSQYDQMVSMGLYPGKKIQLFSRSEM